MNFTRNRLVAGLLITVGVVTSVVFASQSHAVVFTGQDCSRNSIITCGVTSPAELRSKYAASPELRALYSHFGWTSANINGTLREGIAYKNGTVVVDGQIVATNAHSVGRTKDDGRGGSPFTVSGHTYYEGTTQQRFIDNGGEMYVMFNSDGQFVGAIDRGCGNPIPATPVKPKPPVYTCNSLTATGIQDAEHNTLKFNFQTKATASGGATIKSYSYNFGDGSKVTAGASTSHTYAHPGEYTASVTVTFTVKHQFGATTTETAVCKACVKPVKNVVKPPVVTCTSLNLITVKDGTYNLKATAAAMPGNPYVQTAGAITGYTYTVKDANGHVVKTINQNTSAQSAESGTFSLNPGNYVAQVVVHSNAGDKTGSQCTVKICVPQPPKTIQVCRLSDHQIVTINENDFNSSTYSKDLSQCKQVQACDLATYKLVNVYPSQIDNKTYTTDLTKCQPVQVCDTTTHQIVTIPKGEAENSRYTTDLSKCQPVEVCDTTTGTLTKVYPSQIDGKRYTTDLSLCQKVTVCDTTTHQIVTVPKNQASESHYTTDLSQCAQVQACDTTTGTLTKVYPSQIDNQQYTTDLSKCYVQVCDTDSGTIVTVLKSEANGKNYTSDLSQCTKEQVCDLTTHQIVTVTKSQAENNSNYTSDTTQCQQVPVCDTTTGQVVKVYPSQIDNQQYTTDMTKCTPVTPPVTPPTTPPTPTTPVELPHTGASNVVMSLFGAGSLIAAVSYYVASRRALS